MTKSAQTRIFRVKRERECKISENTVTVNYDDI